MAYDYSKLRGRIKEVYGTQKAFATAMNIGTATLSTKLNNKRGWNQNEMLNAARLLKLEGQAIEDYFFKESI